VAKVAFSGTFGLRLDGPATPTTLDEDVQRTWV
jgi:hypothetical protein